MIYSTDTISSIELLKKFPNHPMVGTFNTQTKQIALAPCITERVVLEGPTFGNFTSGNFIDQHLNDRAPISAETLLTYQDSGYVPRLFKEAGQTYSAHLCLVQALEPSMCPFNVDEFKVNYRGFTVTYSNNGLNYEWVSGSLNSPPKECIRGQKMALAEQKEVKEIFQQHLKLDPEQEEVKSTNVQIKKTTLAPLKLFDFFSKSAIPDNAVSLQNLSPRK